MKLWVWQTCILGAQLTIGRGAPSVVVHHSDAPGSGMLVADRQGDQDRKLMSGGTAVTDLSAFPGVVVIHDIFNFFGAVVSEDRIVTFLNEDDVRSLAHEDIYLLEKSAPDHKLDLPGFTAIYGTTTLPSGLTVVFGNSDFPESNIGSIAESPSVGDTLTAISFSLVDALHQEEMKVVQCAVPSETTFCVETLSLTTRFSSIDESVVLFNGKEIVGLMDTRDDDSFGREFSALSIAPFLKEILEASPTENFGVVYILTVIGIVVSALAACCFLLCYCGVFEEDETEQEDPQSENSHSQEAPPLPSGQQEDLIIVSQQAAQPAELTPVAYALSEDQLATAIPVAEVSNYKDDAQARKAM